MLNFKQKIEFGTFADADWLTRSFRIGASQHLRKLVDCGSTEQRRGRTAVSAEKLNLGDSGNSPSTPTPM